MTVNFKILDFLHYLPLLNFFHGNFVCHGCYCFIEKFNYIIFNFFSFYYYYFTLNNNFGILGLQFGNHLFKYFALFQTAHHCLLSLFGIIGCTCFVLFEFITALDFINLCTKNFY